MKSIVIIEASNGYKITEFDVLEGIAGKVGTWKGVTCLSQNFEMSFTDLHTECNYHPEMHGSHFDRVLQLQKMREDCAEAMQCICGQIRTLQEWHMMNNKEVCDV